MKNIVIIVLCVMLILAILGFYKLYKTENGLYYDIIIDKSFPVLVDNVNSGLSFQVSFSKFLVQVPQDSILLDINEGEQVISSPMYYDVFLTGQSSDVYIGQIDVVVKVVPSSSSPTLKNIDVLKVSQSFNSEFVFGTISNVYEFVNAEIDEYFSRAWVPLSDSSYENAILWFFDSISFTLRGAYLYIEYIIAPIKLVGGAF